MDRITLSVANFFVALVQIFWALTSDEVELVTMHWAIASVIFWILYEKRNAGDSNKR